MLLFPAASTEQLSSDVAVHTIQALFLFFITGCKQRDDDDDFCFVFLGKNVESDFRIIYRK